MLLIDGLIDEHTEQKLLWIINLMYVIKKIEKDTSEDIFYICNEYETQCFGYDGRCINLLQKIKPTNVNILHL